MDIMLNAFENCKENCKREIRNRIDYSREVTDDEIHEIIDELVIKEGKKSSLSILEREQLGKELFYAIRKLDLLQELIEDDDITEIMINGTENIFIERQGRLLAYEKKFQEKEKLEDVIQQIVAQCNRTVNEANPIVDARLENGSRVNIVLSPIALNGPIVTIRRFSDDPITMEQLLAFGSLSQEAIEFLKKLVISGYNIFISGGTGSGKTTFLNALSQYIPKDERVITIEDSAELQLREIPNLVRMETRNANVEGCREITIRDLIKASLRMRPDRIIVGEVRGAEALDMLQCLNTGHDGSLSTGHANSAQDMLSRLETMTLMGMDLPLSAIRRQMASGIDIIVHLGRLRDKTRKVLEIAEIVDFVGEEILINPIFEFEETGESSFGKVEGQLLKVGELQHKEKWYRAGLQ